MPATRAVERPTMTPEQINSLIGAIEDPHDLCLMCIGLFCATRTSRYLINAAGVRTGFFHNAGHGGGRENPSPTERPHASFTLMRNLPRDRVKVIVPETSGTV